MTDSKYQRNRRRFDPAFRRRQRDVVNARSRALTKLALLYPDDYDRLWRAEMGRDRLPPGRPKGTQTQTARGIPLTFGDDE